MEDHQSIAPDAKTLKVWRSHLRSEADACFLYNVLVDLEPRTERKELFRQLAEVEADHISRWLALLETHNASTNSPRPSTRIKLIAWLARRFGIDFPLSLLLREEAGEVMDYLTLYKDSTLSDARETALTLARESALHAESLRELTGTSDEPWHKAKSGGTLGNIVYGFNDGLTANFGLVAGVIAAAPDASIVLVTGIVGMLADALSMGASGYLAAKSEQEVYEHEIEIEAAEIKLMPDLEEKELALIYETRGLAEHQARQLAKAVMNDPDRALTEKVQAELNIGKSHTTPSRAGWITGIATAIGASIPVIPFLFTAGRTAIFLSFFLAMFSHFAVGAARSMVTGRGLIRSGIDMFVVGLGVAGIGYLAGTLLERFLLG